MGGLYLSKPEIAQKPLCYTAPMPTMHLTSFIKAPVKKVWDTMLNDATYRQWTHAFHPGSYYKGSWEQGSKILFLGPSESGDQGGMVAHIVENRPHEFVSIEMLGEVRDGKEDTTSEAVQMWKGAHENYTFTEKDGGTELSIDTDAPEDFMKMMEPMWEKALVKLKELCEQ